MNRQYVVTRIDGTQISVIGDYMRADSEAGMIFVSAKNGGLHELVAVVNVAEIVCVVSADALPVSPVP